MWNGIFKQLFSFNWRIIALQYCVGFCHTSTWISHRYIHVPSFLNLPPAPPHPTLLGCHRALGWSSLHHTEASHWLSILHMVMHRFQCYRLSLSHPLLPSKWDFYLTWRWHTLQLPSIQHMHNRRNISLFIGKKPWCWERLRAGGEGDDWGRDGWMVSTTQQTWVWASSGRWWRTGEPGVLQSVGSQGVGHKWATEQQQSSKVDLKSSSLKKLWLLRRKIECRSVHI